LIALSLCLKDTTKQNFAFFCACILDHKTVIYSMDPLLHPGRWFVTLVHNYLSDDS
jgi:hypothetical protein